MREILFRGKRVDNGEWLYSVGIKSSPITTLWNEDDFAWKSVDRNTIGQFTGLCDKNGKKIFEGDIVSVYSDCDGYYIEKRNLRGVVVFDDEQSFDYEVSFNHIRNCCLEYLSNHRDNIEVIGNIYDNSELLKKRG